MITEIPEAALKMIQDEAWEFFQNAAGVGTDKRGHLADTIEHAFQHALEEGIVTPPIRRKQGPMPAFKEIVTVDDLIKQASKFDPQTRVAFFPENTGKKLCVEAGGISQGGKWFGIEIVKETIVQPKQATQNPT